MAQAPHAAAFAAVETWVFDLDNTLYPPGARLFELIDARMTGWIMGALGVSEAEAGRLRRGWWTRHGTTLAGLMAEHAIDPWPFLHYAHDVPLDRLAPDPALAARIAALPGRRIVYTNGSVPYARRVLAARGLAHSFDAVYGVEDAGFRPKPVRAAFEAVFARDGLAPARAAMFEDDPRNLLAPWEMGMRTVHVAPAPMPAPAPHVEHHAADLAAFLAGLGA
ncbi:MAG: pyrimidine 5'-nucleotidase [Rhodobacteraceae bacterium]|nr:pyrimidine 5'-nucleotidase [Paracoccaceae bacterium]